MQNANMKCRANIYNWRCFTPKRQKKPKKNQYNIILKPLSPHTNKDDITRPSWNLNYKTYLLNPQKKVTGVCFFTHISVLIHQSIYLVKISTSCVENSDKSKYFVSPVWPMFFFYFKVDEYTLLDFISKSLQRNLSNIIPYVSMFELQE